MKTFLILPARLDSSRLKHKLLRKIGKLCLIEHMIIVAKRVKNTKIIVATDSIDICDYAKKYEVEYILSRKKFNNGSERVFHAAKKFNAKSNDIIVNLQADEFNINYRIINRLINFLLTKPIHAVATPIYPCINKKDYLNRDNVKVILDNKSKAITFSRHPISSAKSYHYIHMGIYAYRFKSLFNYVRYGLCDYELNESLEQLRMIWNNVPVHCLITKKDDSIGINSLNDLKKARKFYGN